MQRRLRRRFWSQHVQNTCGRRSILFQRFLQNRVIIYDFGLVAGSRGKRVAIFQRFKKVAPTKGKEHISPTKMTRRGAELGLTMTPELRQQFPKSGYFVGPSKFLLPPVPSARRGGNPSDVSERAMSRHQAGHGFQKSGWRQRNSNFSEMGAAAPSRSGGSTRHVGVLSRFRKSHPFR